MEKRAYKMLTIDQKLELLNQIGKKLYAVLCEKYKLGHSTIADITNRKPSLGQYKHKMTDMGVKLAKTMKLGWREEHETVLQLWFKQKREDKIPITGAILQAQACELHKRFSEAPSYTSQKNPWVAAAIFPNWFHKMFVPTVQAKLKEMSSELKAVLLFNNCSAHADEGELTSEDGKIIAKFLSPNVTSKWRANRD